MIHVEKIRDLEVAVEGTGERTGVAAASSLVRTKTHLYVVADNLRGLAVFESPESSLGRMIPLAESRLADEPEKGDDKADLEGLCYLPPSDVHPHGALLALGSGSSPKRLRGVLIRLDEDAQPERDHPIVDLSPLYAVLSERIQHLNIEGCAVVHERLRLFHRSNEGGDNATIDLHLGRAVAELERGSLTDEPLQGLATYDLGRLRGVPLCFSDASPIEDGRTVFVASAETSSEGSADGEILGSAIGMMDRDGAVEFLEPIDVPVKIEGMTARIEGSDIELFLVTDQDDDAPSPLLRARLPL